MQVLGNLAEIKLMKLLLALTLILKEGLVTIHFLNNDHTFDIYQINTYHLSYDLNGTFHFKIEIPPSTYPLSLANK